VLDRIELRRSAIERVLREEKSTADQISSVMGACRKSLDEPIKSAVELQRFFAPENIAKLRHLEFGRSWPYRHASLGNDYSIKLVE
jgi:hypothetical protein